IRPLESRTGAAQPKESADREDIEQQHCKDNIVEQIVIAPAERQQTGPEALNDEGENGCVMPRIELARTAEEQIVAGHGEVDAGARHDHAVAASEGGDHD